MHQRVVICGVNTARLPVLTPEEITELLEKSHSGSRDARNALIAGNLRLVLSVVQRFQHRSQQPDDLFQVGCIGLMKAIDHFDTALDVRFSTYAVPMILGEVRRYLRDNSALRVSRSLRDTAYRAMQTREAFRNTRQREPSEEELAALLDISRQELACALDAVAEPVSLFEPLYTDGADTVCIMDQVRDPDAGDDRWLDRIALEDAMDRLDPRQRRILELRYREGQTQMEIAGAIGISQAQVSRLEKAALAKLRKHL